MRGLNPFRVRVTGQLDEVVEGLLMRASRLDGQHSAKELSLAWGIVESRRSPFGGQTQWAYEILSGAGAESLEDFAASHSYIPLFKPFVNPDFYSRILTAHQTESLKGPTVVSMKRQRDLLKRGRWMCRLCAQADGNSVGYPALYRTHHIGGVLVCPLHAIPLAQLCDRCWPTSCAISRTTNLAAAPCNRCRVAVPDSFEAAVKYARMARAALLDQLPYAPLDQRVSAICKALQMSRNLSNRTAVAAELQRRLKRVFPHQPALFLGHQAEIALLAFLVSGRSKYDPLLNLSIASVVYSDVDEYKSHLTKDRETCDLLNASSTSSEQFATARSLASGTFSARRLVRASSQKDPGLEALALDEEIASMRSLVSQACLRVIGAARRDPSANFRTALRVDTSDSYRFLLEHDQGWLLERMVLHWRSMAKLGVVKGAFREARSKNRNLVRFKRRLKRALAEEAA